MKIAIGCDHGGIILKPAIIDLLQKRGIEVLDMGCQEGQSVDYPEYGQKVAEAVADGTCDKGIVICGTGIGISIAANKVKGIRAAVCHDVFTATMCAQHNDANVLALGGRVLQKEDALAMVQAWLDTPFEGGRHIARLNKIRDIEQKYFR